MYLSGAFAGGLLGYYFNIYRQGGHILLGASGAVSSLISYYVLNNPTGKIYVQMVLPLPTWLVGALFIA